MKTDYNFYIVFTLIKYYIFYFLLKILTIIHNKRKNNDIIQLIYYISIKISL